MKTANETIITCLQIETKEGLANVDSICAVPGVGKVMSKRLEKNTLTYS